MNLAQTIQYITNVAKEHPLVKTVIEGDVIIGNDVSIQSNVYIPTNSVIEDNVFIGPCACFTNDKYPKSKQYPSKFDKTIIRRGASIGAGSVVIGGVVIGENAMIGAGSVVTKDIPAGELWIGNPARFHKMI